MSRSLLTFVRKNSRYHFVVVLGCTFSRICILFYLLTTRYFPSLIGSRSNSIITSIEGWKIVWSRSLRTQTQNSAFDFNWTLYVCLGNYEDTHNIVTLDFSFIDFGVVLFMSMRRQICIRFLMHKLFITTMSHFRF